MKQIFTFLASILIAAGLFAQTPGKMTYQAVIRKADGELLRSQAGMRISILQGADANTASEVYSEKFIPYPQGGLVSVEFGGKTGWDAINWSEGTYFIKTEIDPTGGSNYTITGISQFLSVPYALHTERAETATNIILTGGETAFSEWDKDTNDDFSGNYSELSNLPDLSVYLTEEQDSSATNELQALSMSRDTIYLSNGGFVKLPPNSGFSGSYLDLTDVPPNLDTDVTDDFSGNYNDLSNRPTIPPGINSFATQTALEDSTTPLKAYIDELEAHIEELKLENGFSVMTDSRDGNTYDVVKIGSQIWMAENLAYEIPGREIIDDADWIDNEAYDGWCYYQNNKAEYEKYGVLYQWEAAQEACPDGWHIATNAEWGKLADYLAFNGYNYDGSIGRTGTGYDGGATKVAKAIAAIWDWTAADEVGDIGYDLTNNNRSGFSALPSGRRLISGMFSNNGANWWTNYSLYITMVHNSPSLSFVSYRSYRYYLDSRAGLSVRCIRD